MKGERMFRLLGVLSVMALLAGLSLAPVAAQPPFPPPQTGVVPSLVELVLRPGDSMAVTKKVTTPVIPPLVDIFLLEDETGSFWDDITNMQALAPLIWDAIAATGADFTMGVAGFRDFAQDGWGSVGDWVYRMPQDLTTSKAAFVAGVMALTAGGGNDWEEAQLEALHYLAVPAHPAINSNGDADPPYEANDTLTGLQPTWRAGAQRVVLLATDAECHVTGDAGGWPGDAGTTSAAVTAGILSGVDIIVIGLTPGGAGTLPCVDALAAGTGGSVQSTLDTGEKVKDAILDGLKELTTDVWFAVTSDPGLTVTLTPAVHYGVKGGATVIFDETISVAADPALLWETLEAKVTFLANKYPANGKVIGVERIRVLVMPPDVPASSDLSTGLMIGGFGGLIVLLLLWRAWRYQHQRS